MKILIESHRLKTARQGLVMSFAHWRYRLYYSQCFDCICSRFAYAIISNSLLGIRDLHAEIDHVEDLIGYFIQSLWNFIPNKIFFFINIYRMTRTIHCVLAGCYFYCVAVTDSSSTTSSSLVQLKRMIDWYRIEKYSRELIFLEIISNRNFTSLFKSCKNIYKRISITHPSH